MKSILKQRTVRTEAHSGYVHISSGGATHLEGVGISEQVLNAERIVWEHARKKSDSPYRECTHDLRIDPGYQSGLPSMVGGEGQGLAARGVSLPSWFMFNYCTEVFGKEEILLEAARLRNLLLREQNDERWTRLKFESNDPEFSLPVFVAELKECKKAIPNLVKYSKQFFRAIRHPLGRFVTLGDLVAGAWLDFSYGTGAFIRDLMKLWSLFVNLNGKYLKFISGMGKLQSARHLLTLDLPVTIVPPTVRRLYGVDFSLRTRYVIGHPNVREPYSSLTALYRYHSQAMSYPFGRSLFIAQKLGVIPDPQIIWDLIPLSFVLDWVFPIGEWLHRKRFDLVDLKLTIDGAGYGTRLSLGRVFEYSTEQYPEWALAGTQNVRMYTRVRVSSKSAPKALQLGKLTLSKSRNAAALVWVLSRGGKPPPR